MSITPTSEYLETLYEGYGQRFRMEKLLHEVRTEHQHLVIFQNPRMGRVMALDGVIQTTEADEFIYHEMLTHVPILAHGTAKRVLIIGGGDGGMLREVAKHAQRRAHHHGRDRRPRGRHVQGVPAEPLQGRLRLIHA